MNKCAVLGASGHGKVVAEIAELNGYDVCFYDDHFPIKNKIENWVVAGNSQDLIRDLSMYNSVFLGIGDNLIREKKINELKNHNAPLKSLRHPSSVVSAYSKIGPATVIMANAVVNPFSHVGEGSIINTSSTIDHDCVVGNYAHISPGCNLAGGVHVGNFSWIGIGSKVKQLIVIEDHVIVGVGSTVVKNISSNQTVFGCPAQ